MQGPYAMQRTVHSPSEFHCTTGSETLAGGIMMKNFFSNHNVLPICLLHVLLVPGTGHLDRTGWISDCPVTPCCTENHLVGI